MGKEHQTSRAEAKAAMEKATAIREKEAAAFAKFQEDSTTNLGALAKAIPAVEQGMKGAFLQTTSAMVLRRFTMEKAILPDETRQELLAFLSGGSSEEYEPQSGQIVGILKQMEEEMDKALADARAAEEEAIKSYDALMEAKTKEVDALTAQIEKEQTRIALASGISAALFSEHRIDVGFAYNRKEVKDHGEGGNLVGADINGKRCLLVDDVISAGTAIRDAKKILDMAGAKLVGVVIALDRQERTGADGELSQLSAVQSVQAEFGVDVLSIVGLDGLLAYLEASDGQDSSKLEEHASDVRAYRQRYGVS